MEQQNLKKALGFDNPEEKITIFKGDTYSVLNWFRDSNARYSVNFGWYIIGAEDIPDDLPVGITPIPLYWNMVSVNDVLKSKSELKILIENMTHDPTDSQYVGNKGERLDLILTVRHVVTIEGAYGSSNMHIMVDENQNEFIWTTNARKLEINETYKLSGTVKDYQLYRNSKQTILTRCRIKN